MRCAYCCSVCSSPPRFPAEAMTETMRGGRQWSGQRKFGLPRVLGDYDVSISGDCETLNVDAAQSIESTATECLVEFVSNEPEPGAKAVSGEATMTQTEISKTRGCSSTPSCAFRATALGARRTVDDDRVRGSGGSLPDRLESTVRPSTNTEALRETKQTSEAGRSPAEPTRRNT